MARKPRIEFDGAFYHVITRGNQWQKVIKDRSDFLKYLDILSLYKRRYDFFLYAYVLMSNHVHLLMETRQPPLSKILQGINQSYTMYFNQEHKTVGHLFQGRYKAIVCNRDEYLLALVKYIHNNPLRAKIAAHPSDYEWSSYDQYANRRVAGIVDTDQVLRMFSEDKGAARRLFKAYMADGDAVSKDEVYKTVDQRVLGDEEFVEAVKKKIGGDIRGNKKQRAYSLNQIAKAVQSVYGVKLQELRERKKAREMTAAKAVLSLVGTEFGYKNREIADFMGKDPVMVTRYLKEREHLRQEADKVIVRLKENVNS